MKNLLKEVKYSRFRKELNQKEFAKLIELSQVRYSQVENNFDNAFKNIRLSMFLKICKNLDKEFRDKIFNYNYLLTEWEKE